MTHRKLNTIIGASVFAFSMLIYWITLSPTVVFWDVGEFIAAAHLLQVPHPPGAPFFLLITRIFTMVPFVEDIAVRAHFLSGLASALTVMFTYLISVRLMLMWKEIPENTLEKIFFYGASVIGALTLAFSETFWFNAVEAEVYGLSMLFVSSIIWLILYWYDHEQNPRSDAYLLFIAYLIGLSLGVHLLALLTLFSVMLIVYLRHHEEPLKVFFTSGAFIKFGLAAIVIFFVIYPGIVKYIPSMLDGEFGGIKSDLWKFLVVGLILAAVFGIYHSVERKKRILNMISLSFLLIVLGFSTYTMVYIRANMDPPMNENDPSTIEKLVSYLGREQYGQAPLLERRFGQDPDQQAAHQKYSSDLDFLLKYQMNHMYLRYLMWNFVGRESDIKEASWTFRQLYAIPLLLGIIGLIFHWRRDQKMAFVMTIFFLLMGAVLVLYFNMQEPQPRERDYFYVGSFFVFAIWVGMGVYAIISTLKEKLSPSTARIASVAALALALLFVPFNMARTNWQQGDRTGNYVAWDYAYNLLQSLEKDAILFTNGDNDTFPLWYLQDVEGVRRDVRVANLSLLNTNWYIHQLKNLEPFGAKKVPISISDEEIEQLGPMQFTTRQMFITVPSAVKQAVQEQGKVMQFGVGQVEDTIRFVMNPTINAGNISGIRVQDILVYDIIRTSNWQRPVYFAMTVSEDGKIGLGEYLEMQGLAFKLVPRRITPYWAGLNVEHMHKHLFTDVVEPSREPAFGFRWRGLNDPTVYFDEDIRRLSTNYRQAFFALALYYQNVEKRSDMMDSVYRRMESVMPNSVIPMDYRLKFDFASLFKMGGNEAKERELMKVVIEEVKKSIAKGVHEELTQFNPYIILMQAYETIGNFKEADTLLDEIKAKYANVPGLDQFIQQKRAQYKLQMELQGAVTDTAKK